MPQQLDFPGQQRVTIDGFRVESPDCVKPGFYLKVDYCDATKKINCRFVQVHQKITDCNAETYRFYLSQNEFNRHELSVTACPLSDLKENQIYLTWDTRYQCGVLNLHKFVNQEGGMYVIANSYDDRYCFYGDDILFYEINIKNENTQIDHESELIFAYFRLGVMHALMEAPLRHADESLRDNQDFIAGFEHMMFQLPKMKRYACEI